MNRDPGRTWYLIGTALFLVGFGGGFFLRRHIAEQGAVISGELLVAQDILRLSVIAGIICGFVAIFLRRRRR